MTRGIRWYLVGSLVLVSLTGCGISFFAQREAWRHEAETQCLKSGAVKEGPGMVLLPSITGPGICGADFPFKVSALGPAAGDSALGYTDDPLRPPGTIGGAPDRFPPPLYSPAPPQRVESRELRPLDLTPPGVTAPAPISANPPPRATGATSAPYPPAFPPGGEPVPVVPSRAQPTTTVAVTPAATLACPVVSALDRWVIESVQPAARRWFGQPVVEIKQISAYSCRGMNGNPHAHISEHAFGNALDIAGFVLGDGHVVTVRQGWRGTPEEQGFLHDVQSGACQMFTTVLAPGSNRFHYDHMHVDLMRRNSGRSICEPEAIPGEVVAARARGRRSYAVRRPGDYGTTGALGARGKHHASARLPDAQFKDDRSKAVAIPGED
jgi:hypothetical protein